MVPVEFEPDTPVGQFVGWECIDCGEILWRIITEPTIVLSVAVPLAAVVWGSICSKTDGHDNN